MRALIDYRPALRERSGIGEYTHELVRGLAAAFPPPSLDLAIFSSSWKDRLDVRDAGLERVRQIDRRWPVQLLNAAWHRAGWPKVEALAGEGFDVVHSMTPLLIPSRSAAQVITIADLSFLTNPAWTRAERSMTAPQPGTHTSTASASNSKRCGAGNSARQHW